MTQKVSRLREGNARRLAKVAEVNPEIAEIIRVWPTLSPSIRAAALAVIRSESRECRNIIQRKA